MTSKLFNHADGRRWYLYNHLHRTDGPAVELNDGTKHWYQDGRLHRSGGPAVEYADGRQWWWQNGKTHCAYGPAVENGDNRRGWCYNGVWETRESNCARVDEVLMPVRMWLPIASSGVLKFPLVTLIIGYL
jgi:hypothetical protein